MVSSPKEWLMVATFFQGIVRSVDQWVNTYHRLLPGLDLLSWKTRFHDRAMPWTMSSPSVGRNVIGHARATKLPTSMRHHHQRSGG